MFPYATGETFKNHNLGSLDEAFFIQGGSRRKGLELTIITRRNIQCVSARELYEKLEVKERFSKWWNRNISYGFVEKTDYFGVYQKVQGNQYGGTQEIVDYAVTIDTAKEICMIQRSEIGRTIRQYFIEAEKRFREKQTLEYKQARQKSIATRNTFTDTLKSHGYNKKHEYINTTRAMKKPFGITAKKDNMTKAEIMKITAAEYLAEAMLTTENGYHEVNPVCIEASEAVQNALQKRITA